MFSLNFSSAGKRPFLTSEAKKDARGALSWKGSGVRDIRPWSHWEICLILTKQKLFLLLNCLTLSDWEVRSFPVVFVSHRVQPSTCNFLSFLFRFVFFYWIHLKRGKIKKINDSHAGSLSLVHPILLMLAAPSSKFYLKSHKYSLQSKVHRFILHPSLFRCTP